MKIGLIDIEPTIFNTALMQISEYHKSQGDTVRWCCPLTYHKYDKIYCSSLFDFTNKDEVPENAIRGGTGFDVTSRLPIDIETCDLDYSIYLECDTSYIWFSRGCVRSCEFCCVQQKEGGIHAVAPRKLNPSGQYVTVMDNNFFANPFWWFSIEKFLKVWDHPVDFQGIDVRTITDEQCKALTELRHYKRIKIAWDTPADEQSVIAGIEKMTRYIKPYRLMCYVLIGYWHYTDGKSDEAHDIHRINTLRAMGIDPYVMPFDKHDPYQAAFSRWVNNKAVNASCTWQDYSRRVASEETTK